MEVRPGPATCDPGAMAVEDARAVNRQDIGALGKERLR